MPESAGLRSCRPYIAPLTSDLGIVPELNNGEEAAASKNSSSATFAAIRAASFSSLVRCILVRRISLSATAVAAS